MKSKVKISILSTFVVLFVISCNNGAEMDIDSTEPTQMEKQSATEQGKIEGVPVEESMMNGGNQNNGEVKLNPPHGEPGHDCAIAVGAPLNSAPASGGNENNIQLQPNQAQTQMPPVNQTGGEKPKINPPHGEPGHDCAVPVGSPLN